MRRQRQREWTSWVALAAAYLMAVQTLLVGLNLGAMAEPVKGNMSGHVLCLGSVPGQDDTSQPASETSHAAQCCALGCGMFGPTISAPPRLITIVTYAVETSIHAIPIVDDHASAAIVWTPRNARAPPQQS